MLVQLFLYYSVHLYAGVGTNKGAGRASDAGIRVGHEGEVIAAVVDLSLF